MEQLSLENLKEKEEKYNNVVANIINNRNSLSKKVLEYRRNEYQTKDEKELARLEFEESKIIEEITKLSNSLKDNELIIEQNNLMQDLLLNKISKKECTNKIIANRSAKMLNADQAFLSETEINIEKCEKAIKYYEIIGDIKNKKIWEKELENAKNELEIAKQELEEDEKKYAVNKEKNEQKKDYEHKKTGEQDKKNQTKETTNKSEKGKGTQKIGNLTIENKKTDDYELETRKLNGNEYNQSMKKFKDGSYIQKTTTNVLKNGIKNPHSFSSFSTYEYKYNNNTNNYVENSLSPIVDENGVIIGQEYYTNTLNENEYHDNEHNIEKYGSHLHKYSKTMETKDGLYEVEDNIITNSDEILQRKSEITIENKEDGNKENISYTIDNGKESCSFTKNGVLDKRITKTDKGTTIDIYKNGVYYESYKYDKDGNAISQRAEMKKIPNNYIENLAFGQIPTGEHLLTEVPDEMYPEQQKENNILKSAIEATKEKTRTGDINKEIENMQNIVKNRNRNENTKDVGRDDK